MMLALPFWVWFTKRRKLNGGNVIEAVNLSWIGVEVIGEMNQIGELWTVY